MQINEEKLNTLVGQMVSDIGAVAIGPLVIIGDRLGLYKAMEGAGNMTSQDLATKTGTGERYIREWLSAHAAAGYLNYNSDNNTFSMSPEQAFVFSNSSSPVIMIGAYYLMASMYHDEEKMATAIQNNEGVPWGDHQQCLFCGTEKFFRPSYETFLVNNWLPALDGVVEKLESGAKVADIGCGHAASTMIMAQSFPNSQFTGIDAHQGSIDHAIAEANQLGISNISFECATAKDFTSTDFDLITFFDCLHDMGDPVGACAHAKQALKPDGTCMMVEPFANDQLKDNLNPLGRLMYSGSTLLCVPSSLSQEVGLALGAQAGEARLRDVVTQGGFSQFRRATETPFNLILEARI